jgi:hypothetical protein
MHQKNISGLLLKAFDEEVFDHLLSHKVPDMLQGNIYLIKDNKACNFDDFRISRF